MARKKVVVLVMTEEETALLVDQLRFCSSQSLNVSSYDNKQYYAIEALLVKVLHAERQKS